MYSAETWSTTKSREQRLEVNEMRMLRWMCGVTKKDKIRNEHVRGSVKVAPVTKKIRENGLKLYNGHVNRRDEGHLLRRMMHQSVADRGVSGPWGPQFCGALCNVSQLGVLGRRKPPPPPAGSVAEPRRQSILATIY